MFFRRQDGKEVIMSDMDPTADRPWTLEAVQQLTELAREGVSVPVISLKLKRSVAAIPAKLSELGLTAPAGAEMPRPKVGSSLRCACTRRSLRPRDNLGGPHEIAALLKPRRLIKSARAWLRSRSAPSGRLVGRGRPVVMAKRPLNASWQTATAGLPASPRDSDPRT